MRDAWLFALLLIGLLLWATSALAVLLGRFPGSAVLAGVVVGKAAAGVAW